MTTKPQKQATSKTLKMPPKVTTGNQPSLTSGNQSSLDHVGEFIQKQWPRLTSEEVDTYHTDRPRFTSVVRREYNISQEEVDVQLDLIKRQSLYAA